MIRDKRTIAVVHNKNFEQLVVSFVTIQDK